MPKKLRRPRKVSESIISKDVLAKEIARIIDEREMTQTEAGWLVKDAPSQISLMVTGKTRGFAAERLIRTLTRLGRDVDIVVRKKKNSSAGRVSISVKR
jgi:predicted XRE-type DNA-binding protein